MRPSSLEEGRRERLRSLAPSAKLVYVVLAREGPMTQRQLADETRLVQRTIRSGLDDLEDAGLVTSSLYIPDARKDLYDVVVDD